MDTNETAVWIARDHDVYRLLRDKDVFSSDGEKLGQVTAIFHPADEPAAATGNHCLAIMPGVLRNLFGAGVAYVPESTIQSVGEDRVTLNVPSADLNDSRWTVRPSGAECASFIEPA